MSIQTALTTEFPELSYLTREDLEDMLADPAYFQAIFHTLPKVKELYKGQAELGRANGTIAKQNLALQDELYKLRTETKDAFDEAKALEARWTELEREQKEVYQRFTPQFLLMRLRHAATAQDDLSETLASTFVRSTSSEPAATPASGKEVDDFVKEFRELRKTYHKRVLWGDQWTIGRVAWRDDHGRVMSISHITDKLILSSSPSQWKISQVSPESSLSPTVDPSKDVLRSLFLSLSPPFSPTRTRDAIKYLQEDGKHVGGYASRSIDDEEQALKDAVLGRLVAAIYAEALDTLLSEAINSEIEAQWWADLERSRLRVAYHLVQTLPLRISNLFEDVLHVLHSNSQPISFSVFKPSSIRGLLNRDTWRPISITASMFPHLRTHPIVVLPPLAPFGEYLHSSSLLLSSTSPSDIIASACRSLWHAPSLAARYILHYITLPLQLTSQEVHVKRLELERIRDERAEALGELASKHEYISRALRKEKDLDERAEFLQVIDQVLVGQQHVDAAKLESSTSLLDALDTTSSRVLPIHTSLHKEDLRTYSLLRPSGLVRIWPRLLVLPPLTLYAIQRISASQDTLFSLAKDAWETMKGFWRGWLVEPLADIAKTVRTGGEGSIIVQKGSINADLESLERMALSLARDKLNYSPVQLDDLSNKLRFGDLTPILQIYEEDIKRPVRSTVSGTLLRSAFIQIQKAKVDVDQALAGIDKLLKSQELTFAFVGVAPALSLVYVMGGIMGKFIASSSRHAGGGRRPRTAAWLTMRRIERLLITQPRTRGHEHHHTHVKAEQDDIKSTKGTIPPLTTGLLLLSVSSLRQYAETRLPLRSRLREGFLEDVGDLEDPRLGREEKLRVVERMWRSWGRALGWERLAVEVSS